MPVVLKLNQRSALFRKILFNEKNLRYQNLSDLPSSSEVSLLLYGRFSLNRTHNSLIIIGFVDYILLYPSVSRGKAFDFTLFLPWLFWYKTVVLFWFCCLFFPMLLLVNLSCKIWMMEQCVHGVDREKYKKGKLTKKWILAL